MLELLDEISALFADNPFREVRVTAHVDTGKPQDADLLKQLAQQVGNNVHSLSTCLSYLAFSFPRSDNMAIISVSRTVQQSIYQGQIKALHMASQQVRVMD